jgi:drug/metabolite transporter (DMT)-like permease
MQAAGLASIALGALVLVGHSSWSIFENRMLIGDVLFLASSSLAAAYLVYVQQHSLDPMQATALVAVYSGIVGSMLFLAWPAPSALWTAPTTEVLFQAAFQGVGMGICAVLFASYSAVQLGSQRFAVFVAAIPVLSLVLGRSIAGDPIHPYEASAAVLVGAGIAVAGCLAGTSAISRAGPKREKPRTIFASEK